MSLSYLWRNEREDYEWRDKTPTFFSASLISSSKSLHRINWYHQILVYRQRLCRCHWCRGMSVYRYLFRSCMTANFLPPQYQTLWLLWWTTTEGIRRLASMRKYYRLTELFPAPVGPITLHKEWEFDDESRMRRAHAMMTSSGLKSSIIIFFVNPAPTPYPGIFSCFGTLTSTRVPCWNWEDARKQ